VVVVELQPGRRQLVERRRRDLWRAVEGDVVEAEVVRYHKHDRRRRGRRRRRGDGRGQGEGEHSARRCDFFASSVDVPKIALGS